MGGAQALALVTLLGTLGTPRAVGRPTDVWGGPIDVGGGPMDVGRPIGVGGGPMDVVLPIDVGRPVDVWGGPPGVWGGGRPPCGPVNVTVALEKDECPQCRAVTTTACAGFCRTRAPVYRSPLGLPAQSACVFGGVRYERRLLRGCPPGVDPALAVPVATGCRCAPCPMAAADCAVRGLGPAFCGAAGGRDGQ